MTDRSQWLFPEIPQLVRLRNRARRRLKRAVLETYLHPGYRPPLAGVEAVSGFEPRRAEMVATWLLDMGLVDRGELRRPEAASVEAMLRVHDEAHLEALLSARTLGRVFAVDPSEVPVDELMHTLRLAVGGTIEAARRANRTGRPTLNLLGGFHHAGPRSAGGLSALNDVAIAIAALRADGVRGPMAVLDLDAHPPDGTAACVADESLGLGPCWIGSISGARWPLHEGVDETVLPPGSGGAVYLRALDALLGRMPPSTLTFVLAGGDVLAGDRQGGLGLDLAAAAERDRRVLERLEAAPSVWLPAGGYHPDSWRVLATTAALLAVGEPVAPRPNYDPVRAKIHRIGNELALQAPRRVERSRAAADAAHREAPTGGRHDPARAAVGWDLLGGDGSTDEPLFDADDVSLLEGGGQRSQPTDKPPLLLGFYSAGMLELALHRYGIIEHIRRLGYRHLQVQVERHGPGDRFQLLGDGGVGGDGKAEVLIEAILERQGQGADALLYVHWLTLRHPRARFAPGRAALPGQDVPGLGLAKEAGELLAQMALRVHLHGVGFRPASLHVAVAARHEFVFVDRERQVEFVALLRDLRDVPLARASAAVATDEVRCNDKPWRWPAALMVCWLDRARRGDADAIAEDAKSLRFSIGGSAQRLDAAGQQVAGDRRDVDLIGTVGDARGAGEARPAGER